MCERKYSVKEIDQLREACESRWLFGTTDKSTSMWSHSYKQADKDKGVEELVRTYMIAGITAEEIYEADRARK